MPRRSRPCRVCGEPCEVSSRSLAQPAHQRCRRSEDPQPTCQGCGKTRSYKPSWRDRDKPWTCLDCRRQRPGYHGKLAAKVELRAIICEICGKQVPATMNRNTGPQRQKTCGSDDCRKEITRRRKTSWRQRESLANLASCRIWVRGCVECGRVFVARRPSTKTCSDKCRRKYGSRYTSEAIMRRYREDPEFRDLVISRAHNRHARKLGVGHITSPATLITYLMERDHGRCGKCHKPIRAKKGPRRPSIGHIIPLSRGGEHNLENLQAEHLDCNLSANAHGEGGQLLLVG